MSNKYISKILKNPGNLLPSLRKRYAPISAQNPHDPEFTFSDLFIWRCGRVWKTFFKISPYLNLISINKDLLSNLQYKSRLIILTKEGKLIKDTLIEIESLQNFSANISDYLSNYLSSEDYGSFMVFHKVTPSQHNLCNGYLTERGYTSFSFEDCNTQSYVHGNLDAISAKYESEGFESFKYMKSTLFKRRFQLQYLFNPMHNYEIGLSNSTSKKQAIIINFIRTSGEIIDSIKINIEPLGTKIVNAPRIISNYRISLISKLPLARPLIFKSYKKRLKDVFHG